MTINKKFNIVFFIIIIIAIIIYVVPDEWLFKLVAIKDEYKKVSEDYTNMKQNFIMKASLEDKRDKLVRDISILNVESKIFHENIMSDIYEHCLKNNIAISKIDFSEVVSISLNNWSAVNFAEESMDEDSAIMLSVTLEFKCHFHNLLNLMDDIQNGNRDIAITYVQLLTWNSSYVDGVMNLNYYAIPLNIDI